MKKQMFLIFALMISIFAIMASCAQDPAPPAGGVAAPPATGAEAPAAQPGDADATVEVIQLEFFQQKMEEGPQRGYARMIERFHEEFPHIQIDLNTVPNAGAVLMMRIATGDIPPIFSDYPTQLQFQEKIDNGVPLRISGHAFLDRIDPGAIQLSLCNNGELYALPFTYNFMGIFYNIDIFNQHGVEIPTTYQDFIATLQTFQDAGVIPIGLTFRQPGRVGHMFQIMNAAWSGDTTRFVRVAESTGTIAGDPQLHRVAERMLEVLSFANEDAFAIEDTGMWEGFANGQYAMTITGSFARGTILIANPDVNFGVFPLPNDTLADTTVLSGIDAALAISAQASPEEQEAALHFLEFITRTENAQIFSDYDGAPSTVTAVAFADPRLQPKIDKIQEGPVIDWLLGSLPSAIVSGMNHTVQEFLIHQDIDQFLVDLEFTIIAYAP